MEANSTGGQGSRRAVAPSDDDDDDNDERFVLLIAINHALNRRPYVLQEAYIKIAFLTRHTKFKKC